MATAKPAEPKELVPPVMIDPEGEEIVLDPRMKYVGEYKGFQGWEWKGPEDEHQLTILGYVPCQEIEGRHYRLCIGVDNLPIGYETTPPHENMWEAYKWEVDHFIANNSIFTKKK